MNTGCSNRHGPSPRGWGELDAEHEPHAAARTIPTRVGRTVFTVGLFSLLADHPHAGGENGGP